MNRLEELEKLNAERTQGEWCNIELESLTASLGNSFNGPTTFEDCQFIAAMANNASALLKVARAAEKLAARYPGIDATLNEALKALTLDAE